MILCMLEMWYKICYIFDENNIILCWNLFLESFNLVLLFIEFLYVIFVLISWCKKIYIYYKNVNLYEVINNFFWLLGEK